jgi:hypothetical protein
VKPRWRKARKHKFGPKKYAMALRWRLTVRCLDCGPAFAVTISDVYSMGNVLCPNCNKMQFTKPSTVPAYIQQLVRAGWGRSCANCNRGLRDHVGLKCLFDTTTFDGAPKVTIDGSDWHWK